MHAHSAAGYIEAIGVAVLALALLALLRYPELAARAAPTVALEEALGIDWITALL